MSRPSVWLFGDTPLGAVYGASYLMESWARELRAAGWRARTFTPSGSLREALDTDDTRTFVTVPGVGRAGDDHACFSMLRELRRAKRADRPDVLLVTTPLRVGTLGMTLAHHLRVPLVVAVSTDTTGMALHYSSTRMIAASWPKLMTLAAMSRAVRGALHHGLLRPRTQGLSRSAALAAEVVGAMNSDAAELVLLGERSSDYRGPSSQQPVSVFPAGIDRLPETSSASPLRWPEGALRVLYAGRFSKEKSLHLLVEAVAQLMASGVHVHLNLIGGGHIGDDLEALAARLGVGDHITLHDGIPRAELGAVYASADVFAFPSVIDTQAFVLNEAAHEGLPLVVADAINPVVADGESALVVPHDGAGFAEGIARLCDPELRARLGAGARSRACAASERGQAALLSEVLTRASGRAPEAVLPVLEPVASTASPA